MDKKSSIYLVILLVVFAIVIGVIYYAYSSSQVEVDFKFTSSPVKKDKIAPRAILSLQANQIYSSSQPIAVKVMIDSQSNPIDGVDVLLTYSNIKPVLDNFLDKSQSVFTNVMGLRIDQEKKEIRFSALPDPGKSFSGQGQVAIMNFVAVGIGPATIKFNFEPGSTIDSNVSYFEQAQDILWQVTDLNLIIQ